MSKNRNRGSKPQNTEATAAPESQNSGAADNTDATVAEQPVDPFADVPIVSVGEGDSAIEFADFTETPTADPRKYAAVNAAATAERLPTVKGWKHEEHMLVPGSNKAEKKAGSVYGDIQQIVNSAGRAGIPAYVVATMLRRKQVGNKRSVYCNGLPPIGWAEGWINTAVSKNIAGVHPSKQAPAIRTTVTEGEAEAQKQLAANG